MYTVEDAATRGGIGAVGLKRGGGAGVKASTGGSPRDGAGTAGAGATWNAASAWAAAAAEGDGPAGPC